MWLDRARSVLDHALDRFRAEDGGFFDTASDAEALVARPRDPSDNASPSGTSAMVHALVAAAAMTGEGRYRQAAEEALGTVASLAVQAPRFAGWSLAAAEALAAGPLEVAVVGPAGRRATSWSAPPAALPASPSWSPTWRRPASRCSPPAVPSAVTPRRTCVARWSAIVP